MPKTPDRTPGAADEEATFYEPTSPASAVGEVRFTGTRFSMYDSTGEFDPNGDGVNEAEHKALRDLIHFVDHGPADGWASGSYKESVYSGVTLTNETWWESNSKIKKIVQLDVTYSGVFPSTEVWKMYDTDGSSVLVTLTDAISYSGAFESTRMRTWV